METKRIRFLITNNYPVYEKEAILMNSGSGAGAEVFSLSNRQKAALLYLFESKAFTLEISEEQFEGAEGAAANSGDWIRGMDMTAYTVNLFGRSQEVEVNFCFDSLRIIFNKIPSFIYFKKLP